MTPAQRIDPMYVDGDYLARHPTWDVEDSPYKAAQVRLVIPRHGLAPKTICEIGCGAGAILQELEHSVRSVETLVGYEVSPQAHALALERRSDRLSFRLGDLTQADPSVRFDLLLVMDVVEHVEDYIGFLRDLRGRADSTVFYIPLDLTVLSLLRGKLPVWRRELGHLHHFNRETALSSLEHAGYAIDDVFYAWHATERPRSRGAKILSGPRRALIRVNEHLAQTLLGGASLVVLANPGSEARPEGSGS